MTTCSTSSTTTAATTVLSTGSSTGTTSTATTVDETNVRISSESMTSSATGTTSTSSTTQVTSAAITSSTITTGSGGNPTTSTTEISAASSIATSSSTTTTTTLPSSLSQSTLPTPSQPMFVDPTWGKRPPERIGSDSVNDSYYVDDRAEVKMNLNTYKMVFVMNKDVIFYKRHSLRRAKQVGYLLRFRHWQHMSKHKQIQC